MRKTEKLPKMTNSTDSLERFVTAVRTGLKTWPQLLSFRQPMPAEHPSRNFVVAGFVSVVIHACLLWVVVSGRTAVEPTAPSIDTPLIVSLSTFTTTSHDGIDLEVVLSVPHTDPPAQRFQSSPERSSSAEHKSEAETVVTSKDQDVPGLEAPDDKSLATDATPSFDLDAAYRMAWNFGIMPEFKAETVVTSKDQDFPGSETPEGKSFAAYSTPLFGLKAYYRFEREFGRMSEFEVQDFVFKSRILYMNNYIAEARAWRLRHDCSSVYAGKGLFAIPFILRDAITGNGCKWLPEIKEIK